MRAPASDDRTERAEKINVRQLLDFKGLESETLRKNRLAVTRRHKAVASTQFTMVATSFRSCTPSRCTLKSTSGSAATVWKSFRFESARGARRLHQIPWRIYQNDPAWVPPLLLERKEFLDRRKHPFYEHGDAALFLARSGGEIVGRIMASDDPNYNALHNPMSAASGCSNRSTTSKWRTRSSRRRRIGFAGMGRDEIMGPIDYSTNYRLRLADRWLSISADASDLA